MRKMTETLWVCNGCNRVVRVPEGAHPIELELRSRDLPPVRIIKIRGEEVHRCSPTAPTRGTEP